MRKGHPRYNSLGDMNPKRMGQASIVELGAEVEPIEEMSQQH